MKTLITGLVSIVGRVMLSAIFLLSAVGNKIPNFDQVSEMMGSAGVPLPRVALAGAIAFLVVGSVSLILGLWARIGAGLLLVFLALATFYFHAFWNLEGQEAQAQQIQAMKNAALAGAMLFVMANGPGLFSFDHWAARRAERAAVRSKAKEEISISV